MHFNIFTLFVITFISSNIIYAQDVQLSDDDLKKFSEELLKKDNSNLFSKITIDKQGKTNSGSSTDKAPKPLLSFDESIFKYPTVNLMLAMFDNYDPDVTKAEVVTAPEQVEENKLLDALFNSNVMNYTYTFMKEKGLFKDNEQKFKEWLGGVWFTLYSRGHRKKSSSAFEHVFLGELKNNQVSGLHSWIFFGKQEVLNELNYLGWMREVNFGKGTLLKLHYQWKNTNKPVGTLFVGTSPEFEIALYSLCYLVRPNAKCDFTLNGKPLFIQTYTFIGPKQQKLIGSAFPGL